MNIPSAAVFLIYGELGILMLLCDISIMEERKPSLLDVQDETGNVEDPVNGHAKSKVLTHVIDGFVIEEFVAPFPPQVSCTLTTRQLNMIRKRQQEILLRERENEDVGSMWSIERDRNDALEVATATCEQCGFSGPKCRFTPPAHQFCSLGCARKFKSGFLNVSDGVGFRRATSTSNVRGRPRGNYLRSKIMRARQGCAGRGRKKSVATNRSRVESSPSHSLSDSNSFTESEEEDDNESEGSVFSCSPSVSPQPVIPYTAGNEEVCPMYWSVDDVWRYIRSLPDSSQHADDFRSQEIDGSALLLLHEEHLVGSMNLPLGPALKLCAHIDKLRQTI